ncbi:hypothetical protein GCM10025867_51320 (plasmid) [Frondihabitans sucicola]|uniref:Uncharacterized protein n=1 Tax=Frondihabitans sucicola TaxID=1268041 RepID=A0ABM8GV57_9MICO|nr:hypothetical protein [Frondihabitans sucicola]BDZ52324.1 hypothetical protein GCM10025867_45650 [Frondihabitans sucicola]BDZ52891.1 hypothetical protein GCM10025867_51320 [Frondihabitans sucicola]
MPNPQLTQAQFGAITAAVALLEVHLEDEGTQRDIDTLNRAYRKVQDWFEGRDTETPPAMTSRR